MKATFSVTVTPFSTTLSWLQIEVVSLVRWKGQLPVSVSRSLRLAPSDPLLRTVSQILGCKRGSADFSDHERPFPALPPAGEIVPGQRIRVRLDLVGRSHRPGAILAGPWSTITTKPKPTAARLLVGAGAGAPPASGYLRYGPSAKCTRASGLASHLSGPAAAVFPRFDARGAAEVLETRIATGRALI